MVGYIGLDWSGTPDAPESVGEDESPEIYIPCAVGVADAETLNQDFAEWRKRLGVARDFEFHGSRAAADVIQEAVEYALGTAVVSAIVWDKQTLLAELGAAVFEKPALLAPATGLLALQPFLEAYSVRCIWCDEDIQSKERQRAFTTAVKQKARASMVADRSPDVKHYPSNKSNLIQLADMVAYALQRDFRGFSETPERRAILRRLKNKAENRVRMGGGDDLRPYL